jgi:putative acetyltransferase
MQFSSDHNGHEAAIADLFAATFTASEGADEGTLIGDLARDLLMRTAPDDIRVFTALGDGALIACAIFTRLRYARDPRKVFLLSPMAVSTDRQRQGVGQALLRHALADLRAAGVDVATTYGDPSFYGRVGFMPVTETTVPAPRPLSQPQGWIAQSLTGAALSPLQGPATCVAALDDPAFW